METCCPREPRFYARAKWAHTQERIYGHHESTREELRQIKRTKRGGFVGQPCVPYAREQNRCVSALMMEYDGEKLLTDVVTVARAIACMHLLRTVREPTRKLGWGLGR